MQNVGCDNQVELIRLEPLLDRIFRDIQHLEIQKSLPLVEKCLALFEEAGRDVCVAVVLDQVSCIVTKRIEKMGGGASGPGADLDNAHLRVLVGEDVEVLHHLLVDGQHWSFFVPVAQQVALQHDVEGVDCVVQDAREILSDAR